ncbi:MAG: type III PLP-dependent enzyme [Sphingobium sp.]|nr:type III PLP-dependent enzyme [Sphingobium sp.]
MIAPDTDDWLGQAAKRFGTPSFIYFADRIARRIEELRDAFAGRFALSYAVKSNPNPALLTWLNGRVDLLDVSSIGEFHLAVAAGWNPVLISFTGPAKRDFELRDAIHGRVGLLVIESLREARLANAIARSADCVQRVLVRIAPDSVPKGFGDQMAGRPSPFGIDLDDAPEALDAIMAMPNLNLAGLHIYSGTQCLKPEAIVENYRGFLRIFAALCDAHGVSPDKLILGSGLGVAYHDQDIPLSLRDVAQGILPDIDQFRAQPRFADTQLALELGRYLVAEAGFFLTQVVSIKTSRGVRIAICDGGMNNHLPASGHFGMVIRRNYSMHRVGGGAELEKVDLSGPLCTSIDRLGSGVELARLEEGDVVAIHQSGAYGLTASPIHFISHAPPAELMVIDGEIRDVSRFFPDTQPTQPVLYDALKWRA